MTEFSADDGTDSAPPNEEAPASVKGTGTGAGRRSAEDGADDTPSSHRSKAGKHGSWSSDDADRPRWDFATVLDRAHHYEDARYNYLFSVLVGRNPGDTDKRVTTRRKNMLPFSDRFDAETRKEYFSGLGDANPTLYRLPQLLASDAKTVLFIVEGEKDVETLENLGLTATCNYGGARKWKPEYSEYFRGRDVVILNDNDTSGRDHAKIVATSLHGVAASVKVLELPGLPDTGDVTDWIEAGGTKDRLLALAADVVPIDDASEWLTKPDKKAHARKLSQRQVAQQWADGHGSDRRYDHPRGTWRRADRGSGIWRDDERRSTFNEIGQFAQQAGGGDQQSSSANFVRGVETFAQALPGIAVTSAVFDRDHLVLGTPSGPIDLKTGRLMPPDPLRYISKSTSVAPAPGTPSRWLAFLMETTGRDALMVEFLQRMLGYMLTGLTTEQALFFIYGDGGNGKGVFVNVIRRIMGDYAETSAMETFTASRNDQHPTGLAKLHGARLVTASETEHNRPWAEARIKQLTGSDEISARFMRQNFFNFVPIFKLLIIGNFQPRLNAVDDAMRRRFNIIPFNRKPEVPNPNLEAELEHEFPQILNWMVEGCLKWREDGLRRPRVVIEATADYFEDQDVFGQWLAEFCEAGPAFKEGTNDLFHNWTLFAKEVGEEVGSNKGFTSLLAKRGFRAGRETAGKKARYWQGLRLQRIEINGQDVLKTPQNANVGQM